LFLAFHGLAHSVVMVTKGNTEHALGLVLLDHETSEIIAYLAGLESKSKQRLIRRRVRIRGFRPIILALLERAGSPAREMLPHEIGQLPLELLGGRRAQSRIRVHT